MPWDHMVLCVLSVNEIRVDDDTFVGLQGVFQVWTRTGL